MHSKPICHTLAAVFAFFLLMSAAPALAAEAGETPPRAYTYGTRDIPEGVPAKHYDVKAPGPGAASKDISDEELIALDPRTFPQMILIEEDWRLYLPHSAVETPIPDIIADAKQGNPFAAVCLAAKLERDRRAYMLWLRVADALTRPGWGIGVKTVSYNIRQKGLHYAVASIKGHAHQRASLHGYSFRKGSVLDDPMSLFMEGVKFRAATQGYAAMLSKVGHDFLYSKEMDKAYLWLYEACMRGDVEGCIKFAIYYDGGISGKEPTRDPYKVYAVSALGAYTAREDLHNALDVNIISGMAEGFLKSFKTPEEQAEAEAARVAMFKEYEEYRGKALQEQRARRAAVMPEILLQIADWEKEAAQAGRRW